MTDEIETPVEPEADPVDGSDEGEHVTYGRDPVERWLLGMVALVLVVFVGAAGSLVMYVLSTRSAPRSAVERELAVDEEAVVSAPQDVENWARLALTQAKAGRWSDAASAIARGRAVKKAAILDLIEADILFMRKDRGAIQAYDRAIKSAQAEYQKASQVMRADKGVTAAMPAPMIAAAMRGKALALQAAGRTQEGIDLAKKSLGIDPTDADLHVALAQMYQKLGRKSDAEAQYRQALTYIPDYAPALKGLKSLGKEQ